MTNCFKAPAGVKCAKSCITKDAACLGSSPTTKKTCNKACRATNKADRAACRQIADGDNLWAGGDAACLATADANLALCLFVCAEAAVDCHTNFAFCIADCPNL